jgi:hypothetical protein
MRPVRAFLAALAVICSLADPVLALDPQGVSIPAPSHSPIVRIAKDRRVPAIGPRAVAQPGSKPRITRHHDVPISGSPPAKATDRIAAEPVNPCAGDHAPIAETFEVTIAHGSGSNVIDVIAHTSDPDGDSVTVDNTSTSSIGIVQIAADHKSVRYTPGDGDAQTDFFYYSVTDEPELFCGIATARVDIILTPASPTDPNAPACTDDLFLYRAVDTAEFRPAVVNEAETPYPMVKVEIQVKPGVVLPTGCARSFSLASYQTEGATWPDSGSQSLWSQRSQFVDALQPLATLIVSQPPCFGQTDFSMGTTIFDGQVGPQHGPIPHYPDSPTPYGKITGSSGGHACPP